MVGKASALLSSCCVVALAVTLPFASLATKPASRRKAASYLRAADGRQCILPKGARGPIEDESARLRQAGVMIEELAVAAALVPEWLPARCLPKDIAGFWRKHPGARADVKKSGGMVCEACGCPETWFYCVASQSKPALLKQAGYAPVR
jgi:hypothetical protein